ncbi:ATP-binding cassette domain-containing protein [Facklamia miroungae]|uniref:ATPase components of ABC transporters with duplicated ATPase domains n=1 Tax=Facklamia miroungae TaxID=120956 RepID=A0A1G7QVL9_9LACT|nr:ATP-binding cassette domain-containing protein [Facklamia miroungae]NKZ29083.1 ABC-F family ATP-binding cassette domain-containing protein [Facklamia miroungae]SDG02568.1 ATPase components of ABC transporters with duplicated ATPase domains [Facklamia miroungae]
MLQVNNLHVYHSMDFVKIIDNLSFIIHPGEKVAIIGEEGNGKSTLLKWLVDDESLSNYLIIEGEKINHFSQIGYLPQQMKEEDLNLSINKFFFSNVDPFLMDYNKMIEFGKRMGFDLDRVYSDQIVRSLSGGEKIKLSLLRLIAQEPDLILLDEPSNDLDIDSIMGLEKFIRECKQAILFVSHDESLLESTATSIIHLERLLHRKDPHHTVSKFSYKDYLFHREQSLSSQQKDYEQNERMYAQKFARQQKLESALHYRLNHTKDSTSGRLLAKKMKTVKSMAKRFEREYQQGSQKVFSEDPIEIYFKNSIPIAKSRIIMEIRNLNLKIEDRLLVSNINLSVQGQDKIGIIGANGVGKSTLLKYMWFLFNQETDREGIISAYMPQNYNEFIDTNLTPIQFLTKEKTSEELTQIMTFLASMNFMPEEMTHSINELSGGQRAKLFLLKMDFMGANLLFLDEPTRNFSPNSQPEIRKVLREFPGAIISVSHDRLYLNEVCDQMYLLQPDGLKVFNSIG